MENTFELIEQLRSFISEATFTDKDKIKGNTLIFKEGIFDSLGFLSLISFLEQELGIEVANEELVIENFESVNAIAVFVSGKNNSQMVASNSGID